MEHWGRNSAGLVGSSLFGSWAYHSWDDRTNALTERDDLLRKVYIEKYGETPDQSDLNFLRDRINEYGGHRYTDTPQEADVEQIKELSEFLWGAQGALVVALIGTLIMWRLLYIDKCDPHYY